MQTISRQTISSISEGWLSTLIINLNAALMKIGKFTLDNAFNNTYKKNGAEPSKGSTAC